MFDCVLNLPLEPVIITAPHMSMSPPHHARRPSSTTNAPPSPLCAQGAKQTFVIRELPTAFEKLQIEFTKENCETNFFDDSIFFHSLLA